MPNKNGGSEILGVYQQIVVLRRKRTLVLVDMSHAYKHEALLPREFHLDWNDFLLLTCASVSNVGGDEINA